MSDQLTATRPVTASRDSWHVDPNTCPHDDRAQCVRCVGTSREHRARLRSASGMLHWLDTVDQDVPSPVVPGFAFTGRLTLIAGRGGRGKSTLLRQMCAAITVGRVWPGGGDRDPGTVLWLGQEVGGDVRAKLEEFDADPARFAYVPIREVADPEQLDVLEDITDAAITVIDPLPKVLAGGSANQLDERSYLGMSAAIEQWLPEQGGPPRIGIIHSHRDRDLGRDQIGTYYGSIGFEAECDLMFDWESRNPKKQAETGRLLTCCKSRIAGLHDGTRTAFAYLKVSAGGDHAYRVVEGEDLATPQAPPKAGESPDELRQRIRAWLAANPRGSMRKCAEALQMPRGVSARGRAFRAAWETVDQVDQAGSDPA